MSESICSGVSRSQVDDAKSYLKSAVVDIPEDAIEKQ